MATNSVEFLSLTLKYFCYRYFLTDTQDNSHIIYFEISFFKKFKNETGLLIFQLCHDFYWEVLSTKQKIQFVSLIFRIQDKLS